MRPNRRIGRLIHGILGTGLAMGLLEGIQSWDWYLMLLGALAGLIFLHAWGIFWEFYLQGRLAAFLSHLGLYWDPRPDEGAALAWTIGGFIGICSWWVIAGVLKS